MINNDSNTYNDVLGNPLTTREKINMNKRAEDSGGIGMLGLFFVLVVFLFARGCTQNAFQEDVNEFCIEKGFEYGEESIRRTVIVCKEFNGNDSIEIPYQKFRNNTLNLGG